MSDNKKPREVEPNTIDRLMPASIDRERAHLFIINNFPLSSGFKEEQVLARLLARVWNEGWKAAKGGST